MTTIARIDRNLIKRVVRLFPNEGGWRTFDCKRVVGRTGTIATWLPLKDLNGVGGIYVVLLPTTLFRTPRTIHLHGPNQCQIPFEFTVDPLTDDDYGVVYVGRTSNLGQRIKLHLKPGKPKDGGQVKFGLVNSGIITDKTEALDYVRSNGRILYYCLSGQEHCVNRDIIELSLCARLTPPFNFKSER